MSHPSHPIVPQDLLSHQAPIHIGSVTLRARNLAALARYYEAMLGLEKLAETDSEVLLGSGGCAYLRLVAAPSARPESARSAGLFHIAYLLPSRAELGAWFKGASARGLAFDGASDHHVSEAFYLTDPEGNGIKVYADRPRSDWQADGAGYVLTTERMDLRGVVEAAGHLDGRVSMPPATRIGHVHLRVGDIPKAEAFYAGAIGLDIMARRPGGTFYSWGGYHHHIATNTWQSAGAPPRSEETTGISALDFVVRDPEAFSSLAAKLANAAEMPASERLVLADPWAIRLAFNLERPA